MKSIQHLPTRGPLCHPVNIWRNVQFSQQETTPSIIDQENANNYASEYLNTINLSSLPPHLLKLKVSAAVILLCNLSPSTGMCNGTHLRVVRISQRVIECEILAGKHAVNMVFIPRIPLAS